MALVKIAVTAVIAAAKVALYCCNTVALVKVVEYEYSTDQSSSVLLTGRWSK
jgi:hypothetical protein